MSVPCVPRLLILVPCVPRLVILVRRSLPSPLLRPPTSSPRVPRRQRCPKAVRVVPRPGPSADSPGPHGGGGAPRRCGRSSPGPLGRRPRAARQWPCPNVALCEPRCAFFFHLVIRTYNMRQARPGMAISKTEADTITNKLDKVKQVHKASAKGKELLKIRLCVKPFDFSRLAMVAACVVSWLQCCI